MVKQKMTSLELVNEELVNGLWLVITGLKSESTMLTVNLAEVDSFQLLFLENGNWDQAKSH